VIYNSRIPCLFFSDDFAIALFTNYGLQKKIELVNQYHNNLNLKCNFSKTKIMVFKKGGELKETKR
jgi:plasmid rolling circle replication initiator protein Rep